LVVPAGDPSPKFQLNEYGVVPPLTVAVKVTDWPTNGDVGVKVKLAVIGWAATLTVAEPEALTVFASVTVNVSVLEPLTASVRLKVPVPVYGAEPPLAVTVQLNGLPAVTPLVGQDTDTVSGWPATLTLAEPEADAAFASVTVNDSVLVPLVGSVLLIVPVPVYGDVPPEAETVQ